MKKQLQVLALSMAMIAACSQKASAQTLIHYWNFNSFTGVYYTPNIPPIDADYSDLDTAKARIYYAEMTGVSATFSSYEDFYPTVAADSDNVNLQMGDTAGNALRPRNPTDSMYLLFYIPTTHFKNIVLKYGSESSSTSHGPLHQVFSYSVDSGLTWITSGGLSEQSDSAWLYFHLISVSFTDTQANNNPKLVFRINFSGNDTGTSGNNRFDNVTVQGDSIGGTTLVHQVSPVSTSYTLYPNPVESILYIDASIEGARSVSIFNTLGQNVYTGEYATGQNMSINTSELRKGIYFINVTDHSTGNVNTMKFIKQ